MCVANRAPHCAYPYFHHVHKTAIKVTNKIICLLLANINLVPEKSIDLTADIFPVHSDVELHLSFCQWLHFFLSSRATRASIWFFVRSCVHFWKAKKGFFLHGQVCVMEFSWRFSASEWRSGANHSHIIGYKSISRLQICHAHHWAMLSKISQASNSHSAIFNFELNSSFIGEGFWFASTRYFKI